MPKRLTIDDFILKSQNKHNSRYSYDQVVFVNAATKVKIYCPIHGYFEQTPSSHISGRGCPKCAHEKRVASNKNNAKNQQLTQEEFISRAESIHGEYYDYSKTIFKGIKRQITVICPEHGDFQQMAQAHIHNKQGCPTCFKENRHNISGRRGVFINFDVYVQKAKELYGELYEYTKDDYINRHNKKIKVFCNIHQEHFYVLPSPHINSNKKAGCPLCASERFSDFMKTRDLMDNSTFISKAAKVHGGKYDYSPTNFRGVKHKIDILCPEHGIFTQRAEGHLNGNGCQKCAGFATSDMEQSWLDSKNILTEQRQVWFNLDNKRYKVDGFDPITNTVYEFLGDFWHGNPSKYNKDDINPVNKKSYGELFNETMIRIETFRKHGYNIEFIWEMEWINENNI